MAEINLDRWASRVRLANPTTHAVFHATVKRSLPGRYVTRCSLNDLRADLDDMELTDIVKAFDALDTLELILSACDENDPDRPHLFFLNPAQCTIPEPTPVAFDTVLMFDNVDRVNVSHVSDVLRISIHAKKEEG